MKARALHYVFRQANRSASYHFYTGVLGMKVLRHEEFEEKCKAACNGPFDGVWSKTMIGYGNEDEHFVIEMTYNYGVKSYEHGNDFHAIHIASDEVLKSVEKAGGGQKQPDGSLMVKDPDGHSYFVSAGKGNKYPVVKVSVNVADLEKSKDFWSNLLGMTVEEANSDKCVLSYGENQCKLELISLKGAKLERGTAFGRIAFSTPTENLEPLQAKMKAIDAHYIQFPLVALETPGKATAHVVILRDPNEHEICFVGDEGFTALSKEDPAGAQPLLDAIDCEPHLVESIKRQALTLLDRGAVITDLQSLGHNDLPYWRKDKVVGRVSGSGVGHANSVLFSVSMPIQAMNDTLKVFNNDFDLLWYAFINMNELHVHPEECDLELYLRSPAYRESVDKLRRGQKMAKFTRYKIHKKAMHAYRAVTKTYPIAPFKL